jgi:phosphatidylinositol-3-phosphatase
MRYRLLLICLALMTVIVFLSGTEPSFAKKIIYKPLVVGARPIDRVFLIMMENQDFDEVIGRYATENVPPPSYQVTPYITSLAETYGLATLYFGVTHPSLPNYLSQIGGDWFGISDDNPSCAVQPAQTPCHPLISGPNLIDQIEASGRTWAAFEQSMPSVGYLGDKWPTSGSTTLYAMKHNPFVYFKDIATNPVRLTHILPYHSASDIAPFISNPATAPDFVYIVPDQCHDMHGTGACPGYPDAGGDNGPPAYNALLEEGDNALKKHVKTNTISQAFTHRSNIIVEWDED